LRLRFPKKGKPNKRLLNLTRQFQAKLGGSSDEIRTRSGNLQSQNHFIKELENAAIVRELHVYGQALNLGQVAERSQHRGMGKELMKKAEELSKKRGYKKLAVISGVGVREYYEKLGYKLEGNYMVKDLI
jgi:histone acetyltransferase (RNA polymerase elongator complex component)